MIEDKSAYRLTHTKEETEAARDALTIKLYDFLAKHSAKYTLNDSSSLPTELAEELFRSLCYVLGIDEDMPDQAAMALADADLDARFAAGIKRIQRNIILAKKLWRTAVQSLPSVENTSLYDTLASIKRLSQRYDYCFFAHQVPCDIDYQLANPVPETLLGIDYVIAWLKHLLAENAFLGHFAREDCVAVLGKACPDYIGLHINLYAPIAAQALGVALVRGDVRALSLSSDEMEKLTTMLTPIPHAQRERLLMDAAKTLAVTLRMMSQTSQDYLTALAKSLVPRIEAALTGGGLEGVFRVKGIDDAEII